MRDGRYGCLRARVDEVKQGVEVDVVGEEVGDQVDLGSTDRGDAGVGATSKSGFPASAARVVRMSRRKASFSSRPCQCVPRIPPRTDPLLISLWPLGDPWVICAVGHPAVVDFVAADRDSACGGVRVSGHLAGDLVGIEPDRHVQQAEAVDASAPRLDVVDDGAGKHLVAAADPDDRPAPFGPGS